MTRQISQREAAENFDALVGTLRHTKEPIEVEHQGHVVAVVLSPDAFETWERRAFFAMLDEMSEATPGEDPDQVLADVTSVVEEVRQARYERRRS